jgi:hypothetical protein
LLSKNIKIRVNRTIKLPVVLYGCETWSVTLREEHRLRVFENRVLRRIFGPKRIEVIGECRRLHKEEFDDLYSDEQLVKNELGGTCSTYEKRRGARTIFLGRPQERRPIGRVRRR